MFKTALLASIALALAFPAMAADIDALQRMPIDCVSKASAVDQATETFKHKPGNLTDVEGATAKNNLETFNYTYHQNVSGNEMLIVQFPESKYTLFAFVNEAGLICERFALPNEEFKAVFP